MSTYFNRNATSKSNPGSKSNSSALPNNQSESPQMQNNGYTGRQGERPFKNNSDSSDLDTTKRPFSKNINPSSYENKERRNTDYYNPEDNEEEDENLDKEEDEEDEDDYADEIEDDASESEPSKAKEKADALKKAAKDKIKSKVKQKTSETIKKKVEKEAAEAAAKKVGFKVIMSKALPYVLAGVGIIILIILLIVVIYLVVTSIFPGTEGDDESNYSKQDKEILQKIASYTQQHPNVDGALALAVIYYPHNESIFSGNVLYYIEAENEEVTTTAGTDTEVDEDIEEKLENSEKDEDGDINDANLEIIEDHLNEFGKVLQSMETQGKNFANYLKSDYFLNNKYYKRIINRRVKGTDDQLSNAIYDDVEELATYMQSYIRNYSNGNCTVSIADGGKINFDAL